MIDFRTVFISAAVATSLLALMFTVVSTQDRRRRNFGDMIITQLLMVLGFVFIALRGILSFVISVSFGSTMLMAACAMLYVTVIHLRTERAHLFEAWSAVGAFAIVLFTMLALDASETSLALFTSLSLAAAMACISFVVARGDALGDRVVNLITAAGIGVGVAACLWRSVRLGIQNVDLLDMGRQSIEQGLFALVGFCSAIVATVGLLMMHWNRSEYALYLQSTRDSLTGVLNRRAIVDRAERDLMMHRRSGMPLCVMILDLDFFKKINDTYGHHAGDDVLIQFADMVTRTHRRPDLFARYGGEEFMIVLPQTNALGASILGTRLRKALKQTTITSEGKTIPLTMSAGIAEWNPDHDVSLEALISNADLALYEAKRNGRDRVEVFDPHAAPSEAA